MHLSKLQGKRSLGLSALLAQRNSDTRPVGSLLCPSDEASSESKFSHSDEQLYSVEQPYLTQVAAGGFEIPQESFNVPDVLLLSQIAQEKPLLPTAMKSSTGTANWSLHVGQCTGTANWKLSNLTTEVVQSQSYHEHAVALKCSTAANPQMSAPHADVNIFHQNSRDINASFIEKQKKIIVDLNAATSSIKLQLQCMQQERDDLVLENSALHAAIEEQRHEQQTQLLSFSLKLLQDEAEMRKSHDELHRMRSEITL